MVQMPIDLQVSTEPIGPVPKPLVVDLDGTLLKTDLLLESFFAGLGRQPFKMAATVLTALLQGRAALKASIAASVELDPATLPYNDDVLGLVRARRAQGGKVYLASASNAKYVNAVAEHLGLFDGVFASTESHNLKGTAKAELLVREFGARGFDYIGNEAADMDVWQVSDGRMLVGGTDRLTTAARARFPDLDVLPSASAGLRDWIKMLRPHQWAKNALVFVPIVTSHKIGVAPLVWAMMAFWAFSFTASAVYVLNDLADLAADRSHPRKRLRPIAAGKIPILGACLVIPLLLALGIAIALSISLPFAACLAFYFVLTTGYTFLLKRKMLADVIALAMLYTLRVVGGAIAISVSVSEWILAFSMFIFTSLALMKRYVELATLLDKKMDDPNSRNYRKADLPIVAALAAATSFNAVTVFSLYISSDVVKPLYRHPQALWLVCPILMYWLGRALMLAHRREMDDDPIVFALRDRNSYAAVILVALILLGASL